MAYFVVNGNRVEDPRYDNVVEFAHAYAYRVEDVGYWLPQPPDGLVLGEETVVAPPAEVAPKKRGKKDA